MLYLLAYLAATPLLLLSPLPSCWRHPAVGTLCCPSKQQPPCCSCNGRWPLDLAAAFGNLWQCFSGRPHPSAGPSPVGDASCQCHLQCAMVVDHLSASVDNSSQLCAAFSLQQPSSSHVPTSSFAIIEWPYLKPGSDCLLLLLFMLSCHLTLALPALLLASSTSPRSPLVILREGEGHLLVLAANLHVVHLIS